jgi:ribose/xylose/arabinose/galactoside ABC-type transport system permease subunit
MKLKSLNIKKLIISGGIYIAFLILCVILSFASPSFLTISNISNVFRQVSVVGIMALAMTYVIIIGGIDLSIGSIMSLCAVVACSFATKTNAYPISVAIAIGIGTGIVTGLFNGLLIALGRIPPFIVTLASMAIFKGITLIYCGGRPVINLTDDYVQIGSGYIGGIATPIVVFVALILIAHFFLKHTRFGRYIYAVGGNEQGAYIGGINVNMIKIITYALSGVAAAISGIILSSRVMVGSPVVGEGIEMDVISSVVIGGASITGGGIGKIFGTVIGVLLMGIMSNGLDLLNVPSYYQQVVKGMIIILAVLMERKK